MNAAMQIAVNESRQLGHLLIFPASKFISERRRLRKPATGHVARSPTE